MQRPSPSIEEGRFSGKARMSTVEVRQMRQDEIDAVILLWRVTKKAAYPYLPTEQAHTLEDDTRFFREVLLPGASSVWVAADGERLLGYLALQGSYIDRLYIHPEHQRQGVGTALLAKARELSPAGLELHTHVQNKQARAFYEKHGFRAVKFGVSPPPERAPDVEYHWRP
jgi:ribosomal protein S18 acetylase RimI-like enzyme